MLAYIIYVILAIALISMFIFFIWGKRQKKSTIVGEKQSLENILISLSASIKKLELERDKTNELLGIIESLIESYKSPLLVTILGEFSSGKSTFINAILREKLLAMKQRETTATITKLQYGAKKRLNVYFKDNTSKTFEILDNARTMDDYIVENNNNTILDCVKYVSVELNNGLLENIDLVDTPGFNSSFNRHTEITKDFIKYSDLVIWLFDARKMGKSSEFKIISEHCKYFKPIGVVNWINKLSLKEGETVEGILKTKIDQYSSMFEKFFFISALDALNAVNGEYKKSGVQEVVDYFITNIIPEGTERKNNAIIQRVRNIGAEIEEQQNLLLKQKTEYELILSEFHSLITSYESAKSFYERSIKNWGNDCEEKNNVHVIKNIDNYFLGSAIPDNVVREKNDFIFQIEMLQGRRNKLKHVEVELYIEQSKLDNEYKMHQALVNDYHKNHPWKSGIEDFLGVSLSAAKKTINKSAGEYDEHSNSFNFKVDAYNRDNTVLNNDIDDFDNSSIYFLNEVVLPAINKQVEVVNDLLARIESKRDEVDRTEVLAKKNNTKLNIINSEIVQSYKDLLQFIEKHKSTSLEEMNLTSILDQIDLEVKNNAMIDWSKIYSRANLDNIINQKISSKQKIDGKEIKTENRSAERLK